MFPFSFLIPRLIFGNPATPEEWIHRLGDALDWYLFLFLFSISLCISVILAFSATYCHLYTGTGYLMVGMF